MKTFIIVLLVGLLVHIRQSEAQCSATQSCPTAACCSQWGFCGYGPDFCGSGCVRDCDAKPECGQFATEATCPLNVCCSQWGFCGTTSEFCGSNCQSGCGEASMPQPGGGNGNIVGGYYASWASTRPCDAWTPNDIDPRSYTHLFYAFAGVIGGVMAAPTSTEASAMNAFTALKNQNPALKCIVSVGGWAFNDPGPTQSEFHNIAASSSSRATFISSVSNFLSTYNFDGIDIDWEYPVAVERGGHPEDKENYLLLIQEMRAAFGSSKLISIAAPASYWYLRHFLIGQMSVDLDFINLMTYDFHGVWNQNNELGTKLRSHTDIRYIEDALKLLARDSVPAGKIILGLGYYGRSYTLQSSSCNTIEQCDFSGPGNAGPCTGAAGVLSWIEIENIITANSLTPIFDATSQSNIITWNDQWVSYDGVAAHDAKRSFARNQNLGGFMVWSIDQGSTNSQIAPMTEAQMKWYQCINYPDHCCSRMGTFCYPNCAAGCIFDDVMADAQFSTGFSSASYLFTSWMTYLPDSLRLTEMSIPGTHDTAAINTNLLAQTQTMSISEQLESGIRALDIRCRHINNVFAMHHDVVFLDMYFGDVLNAVCEFLANNPGEMVIMRIKKEHTEENTTRTFQQTLDDYLADERWAAFFDTSSALGNLGQHRGKILILNNHDCSYTQYGYCWGDAQIQDEYTLPFSAFPQTHAEWKMDHVTAHWESSNNDNNNLYINFLSSQLVQFGITPFDVAVNPFSVGVNQLATIRLNEDITYYKKLGINFIDFAGSTLIYHFLMRN